MTFKSLTDSMFVFGQIDDELIREAYEQGIRVLINNRPDGEMIGQPKSVDLERAAKALGMIYFYLPVIGGQLNMDTVEAFIEALNEADGPVLAFCRSGTRSTNVWALSQAGHMPSSEILERAASAGYNLSHLEPYLASKD